MTSQLVQLNDAVPGQLRSGRPEFIDLADNRVYADAEGKQYLRTLEETEFVLGAGGKPVRAPNGEPITRSVLCSIAAMHAYREMAQGYRPDAGRGVLQKLRHDIGDGERLVAMGLMGRDEQKILLDLGIADVHQPANLASYAGGYRIAEGVADVFAPPIMVPKQQDYYFNWNTTTDFNRKQADGGAPGAQVSEVNPGGSFTLFSAQPYALGGFLPTEVQANADAPLRPFAKLTQMVVDALLLEREWRVQNMFATTSNWNSSLVTTLTSGAQWDGGASSDPIANLHKMIEQSYMPPTAIVWSEQILHDLQRNPALQKFIQYKDGVKGTPDLSELEREFELPPIYTAKMKYVSGGTLSYVWGNNVYMVRQPKEMPPTSQMDIATALTLRWNGASGGNVQDQTSMAAGFLVRTFWDPSRGARGGTKIVVVHNDAEVMTSGFVGGALISAHQ